MILAISEEWIRHKVDLGDRDADEVSTLALPGTHLEKISDLDGALKHFNRLKFLDLSHNAIYRLEGLKSLKLLKKLNLYYNNVANLDELLHLRHNTQLEELDLRLNPVAKNAPDYRLVLVHLLPNLRRLDERAIRDSERKAALMLFSTDTASKFSLKPPPEPIRSSKPQSLRTQHVKSLAKPINVLDDDDIGVMEILRSSAKNYQSHGARAESYDSAEIRQMNRAGIGYSGSLRNLHHNKEDIAKEKISRAKSEDCLNSRNEGDTFQTKYPNISALTDTRAATNTHEHKKSSQTYKSNEDPNLKFVDEATAYTAYIGQGYFTPAKPISNGYRAARDNKIESTIQKYTQYSPELQDSSSTIVTNISNLVDKYWNGSQSLLSNKKFVGHLYKLLHDCGYATMPESSQQENDSHQVQQLKLEVQRLQEKIQSKQDGYSAFTVQKDAANRTTDDHNLLIRTQTELSITRNKLKQYLEKNRVLQQQIDNFTRSQAAHLSTNERQLDDIVLENTRLHQDIQHLQQQLSENGEFRGLARMLQQSHQSLIETNKHLVKEMEELKQTRAGGH